MAHFFPLTLHKMAKRNHGVKAKRRPRLPSSLKPEDDASFSGRRLRYLTLSRPANHQRAAVQSSPCAYAVGEVQSGAEIWGSGVPI